jgi:hypothetical protein
LQGCSPSYASAPPLVEVHQRSLVDRWLSSQNPGVVVQLPMPTPGRMWPSLESRFMFDGMAHWFPTVNGYSGFLPPSYLELVGVMQSFPDEASLNYLRGRRVRYIVLRPNFFDPAVFGTLRERIEGTASLKLLAGLPAPGNELVFGFRE